MNGGIILDTNDVAEVDVQQDVDGCVGHIFRPEELAERSAGSPKGNLVVKNAILTKNIKGFLSIIKNLRI